MTTRPPLDVLTDAVASYATASNLCLDPKALASFVQAQLALWGWSVEPSNRVTVDADWLAGVQAALGIEDQLHAMVAARDMGLTIQERAQAFDVLARALRMPLPRRLP